MITYKCECGKTYRLDDDKAGKRVRCQECGASGVAEIAIRRLPVSGSGRKENFGKKESSIDYSQLLSGMKTVGNYLIVVLKRLSVRCEYSPQHTLIGLVGCSILFLGAFFPVANIPVLGTMSYVGAWGDQGKLVLGLSLSVTALILMKRYKLSFLFSAPVLIVLIYDFIRMTSLVADLRDSTKKDLAGNPFEGIANALMQQVGLQWGWGVMFIGALMIASCTFIPNREVGPETPSSAKALSWEGETDDLFSIDV